MTYSIGRKYHCEAKGKDSESQPLVWQDGLHVFQVKVLTSGSSIPLATQSVAASTTLSTSASALSNQGKLYNCI